MLIYPFSIYSAHHKAGIKIDEGDTLSCIMELMNESAETRVVYLTISAEFVSGAAAQGYSPVQLAWLDATGCGASNVPAQEGQYQLKTPVWKSTIAGKALLGTGHTHDGGVNLTIFKNNQPWCVSQMIYGRRAEVVEPKSGNGGHAGHNMPHISDAGTCRDFGDVKVGDELYAIS